VTQQRIDGTKVWVVVSASGTGGPKIYHTHEDCSSSDVRPIGLSQLTSSYRKCEYCRYEDGDREEHPGKDNDFRPVTCPVCGNPVPGARHIRHCSGGDE